MSTFSNSNDVRTTRYTIKANVETTRYFNSPDTDIEQKSSYILGKGPFCC